MGMRRVFTSTLAAASLIGLTSCATHPISDWELVESRAKAPSFVQGLEFTDEHTLVEASGLYGESFVRSLQAQDPTRELVRTDLPEDVFAEGLAQRADDSLLVGTWDEERIFTLDEQLQLDSQGPGMNLWGMCAQGDELIVSDGSETLRRLDAHSLELISEVEVEVGFLNELECIPGTSDVLANEFMSFNVHRIDASTGELKASWDLSRLQHQDQDVRRGVGNSVLNGLAIHPDDAGTGRVWVTGKEWEWMYLVDLDQAATGSGSR